MSKIAFAKYSALGNDFILFEKKAFLSYLSHKDLAATIRSLCHRRRSIGADGVILYEALEKKDHFAMEIYNSDGSNPALCGNGLRSLAHYLSQKHGIKTLWVQSSTFLHRCEVENDNVTCVMVSPTYKGEFAFPIEECTVWHLLECGVPHLIGILPKSTSIKTVPLEKLGKTFQNHNELGIGTVNVSVVEIPEENTSKAHIRTYERGVFAETESCGTASMCAAFLLKKLYPKRSLWNLVFIEFDIRAAIEVHIDKECLLHGDVCRVFEGFLLFNDESPSLAKLQLTNTNSAHD